MYIGRAGPPGQAYGPPRGITVDKNAASPPAFETLHQAGQLPASCTLRQCTYVNKVVEQAHRFGKRRVNPGLGVGSFRTAWRTMQGSEAIYRIKKGQIEGIAKGDVLAQNRVIAQGFGLVA
jgi:transposase, IS6 family